MLKNALLCSVLFAATTAPTCAQEAGAAADAFVLEAGKIELPVLINKAATYLGRNILVNEQEIVNACTGGPGLTLQQAIKTDRDGCEDVLTTLLYTKGFAIITRDANKHIYEVIALNGPKAREVFNAQEHKSPEQILARPSLVVPVMTVVELEHTNATVANNALRPFFSSNMGHGAGSVTLGTAGNERVMVISGMQNVVANAIRVLHKCDVPGTAPHAMPMVQRLQMLEQRIAELESRLAQLAPPARQKAKGGK